MSAFLKNTKKYKQIMKKYKLIIYFSTFFHPLEKIFIYLLPILFSCDYEPEKNDRGARPQWIPAALYFS